MQNKKILIVGLGLLGGSYAEGLTDAGFDVYALDISSESIAYALNKGIIKDGKTLVDPEYIKAFNVIIFCLYPKVFIEWLKKYQYLLNSGTIITDVTGIKGWLINELNSFLRKDIEFIGAHPMAGKEVYGVQNSDKSIFYGANYIITPYHNTDYAIEVATLIGKSLKFKTITLLSIEEHDEMIGFLSQLTHCIAVSLMTCKDSTTLVDYTGDSFRDLTRIAKINESMWSELFLLNKEELLKQMNLFLKQFEELKKTIENDDIESMKEIMKTSTTRRKYFDK